MPNHKDPFTLATNALTKLENHLLPGNWPSCYPTFEDYLVDFWMDLPWDNSFYQAVLFMILDVRWDNICAKIKDKFQFDMKHNVYGCVHDWGKRV